MSTDNRFALLEVEEVDVKTTKNSPKTTSGGGAGSQPTPAELKKQREMKQKKNQGTNPPPPKKQQNTPPPDFDDTGFKRVVDKKQERLNQNNPTEKKLTKEQFMEKKLGGVTGGGNTGGGYKNQDSTNVKTQSPQQDRNDQGSQGSPSNVKRTQGGSNFRSRASKTNKNRGRIEGDVNDRNPNRPDFDPKKKGFGEDKAPRKQGGGGTGYSGGGGYRKKNTGQNPSRGRQYDKKSGTGIDNTPKKNEAGSYNIGNPIKENLNAEEDAKKEKEESSESSEYFPEPDEEGEEKKDNVVRKGYNTYLQKLEKDKKQLAELLTNKNVPKPIHAEAPKIKEESLPNLNKKLSTDVPLDNEKDAFLFKKNVPTEEKKEKKDEKEPEQPKDKGQVPVTKKVIPITDVYKVKTKKHRGINTIDQLEKKTGGSPKVTPKEDEQKKQDYKANQEKDKDNTENKQQVNTQEKDKENTEYKQQRPRNDNYRGNNRDDNRGQRNRPRKGVQLGRGEFDIGSSDDFPSLSDNIEVPSKPFWLPNQTQQ